MLTGHLFMGILHLMNKMPIKWYSKKQATIKTVTYGSEFITAHHMCVDQLIDHCTTLHYLSVLIHETSYKFGDNHQTIVDSSTIPHAKLHKCHNAFSFHHVYEDISAKFIGLFNLPSKFYPANIMTKHWGYHQQTWRLLQPLLFYQEDTAELFED
jgi:hypothetical protein